MKIAVMKFKKKKRKEMKNFKGVEAKRERISF